MEHIQFIQNRLAMASSTLNKVLEDEHTLKMIDLSADLLANTLKNGGGVFSCGNGGSLCDAMHFSEELTGRFRKDRRALKAMALADPAHMSCVANDYGYEYVFSRTLEAWAGPGDVLLAISTSGNSANILEAVKKANALGVHVIGLSGKSGGQLRDLSRHCIVVPSHSTERIQGVHIKIIHIFIEAIERVLFPSLTE